MYTIDIDIGGTFTDGFFTDGREIRTEKVLTTPHDITECFMNCVEAGSRAFDMEIREFLRRCSVARVSTTFGTNLLVQRSGPRVGLLVTKGSEKNLYGRGGARVIDQYLQASMIEGVAESVDSSGKIKRNVDDEQVLAAVRRLISGGARMIVVSLRNAWRNPINELRIREIVRSRYPVHYLRSVPLQLATEVIHVDDDHARTNSAILNAYIHADMARALYRAEDRLREAGYSRPLLVVHASGGNARVAKTIALHTLHSGPAVAAKGGAHMAGVLEYDKILTCDMGGTSFDVAVIVKRNVEFDERPVIDNVTIATPMIAIEALGAGGGSLARVTGSKLTVGPESAGSAPGPVCYAKGGMEPTVTDANLLLGYIDPGYFLGGRMTLDVKNTERAMQRNIGRPLDLSATEAAFAVREKINESMAAQMTERLSAKGLKPRGFTLFSVGGAGPLHACALAERIGINRIVAFPYGSVFGAFGSSTTNVQHAYAMTLALPWSEAPAAQDIVRELRDQALIDMDGEGFAAADVGVAINVELQIGGKIRRVGTTRKNADLAKLFKGALSAKEAKGAIISAVRVGAESETVHWTPPPRRKSGASAQAARKGDRQVFWRHDGADPTPIYDRLKLVAGNKIAGPAIVEGPDTAYPVAPGWNLDIDAHGNMIIQRD